MLSLPGFWACLRGKMLQTKIVKCGDKNLSTDCPYKGRITPIGTYCDSAHPATYSGCPKTTIDSKIKLTATLTKIAITILPKDTQLCAEILKNFNNNKKKNDNEPNVNTQMLKSKISNSETANILSCSTSENLNDIQNSPNYTKLD